MLRGQRLPYRVIFEEPRGDGSVRRGTVISGRLEDARREATAIARSGRRAEVHYVEPDGTRQSLEEYLP